jgi:hypothetical protein
MKNSIFFIALILLFSASDVAYTQEKPKDSQAHKVEVYYFHPNERCPIDQSIEENTLKLMYSRFSKEIREGSILFQVINTDDKAQAKTVSRFEINAQALYIVYWSNGKEIKNDLTHFAFSNGLSNPEKFKTGLKDEIESALKQ